MVPNAVCAAYGIDASQCVPIEVGLINQTFLVQAASSSSEAVGVLQALHPIFAPEVNLDIEAITKRLDCVGLQTPRLIRTNVEDLWVETEGKTWRMLSFVPGHTIEMLSDPSEAFAAASLIAKFHTALSDWDYEFHFSRPGAHDTEKHLARLERTLSTANSCGNSSSSPHPGALALAEAILEQSKALPEIPKTPNRICHGDLKVSNIRFGVLSPPSATALIDLDTMGWQRFAYEMGDAMRSWCHRGKEDQEVPHFDAAIFEAAIAGYTSVPSPISTVELESVVAGTETICLELSARFCQDIFDDSYFGWDSARFESRRAHNFARSQSQFRLAIDVGTQAKKLLGIVRNSQ